MTRASVQTMEESWHELGKSWHELGAGSTIGTGEKVLTPPDRFLITGCASGCASASSVQIGQTDDASTLQAGRR
ncbi:MAG TPA: hypothetical protein VGG06_32030 [Thermoanaerobaculia bacterium]|jgi:hypothetical protein